MTTVFCFISNMVLNQLLINFAVKKGCKAQLLHRSNFLFDQQYSFATVFMTVFFNPDYAKSLLGSA